MIRLSVGAVLVAGAMLATGSAAGTSSAPPRGSLVFASTRSPDLHDEIWLVDVRSGGKTNLSRSAGDDREATPSPDGSTVAFVSDRGGAEAVWLAVPGSSRPRRLAGPYRETRNQRITLGSLRWSPDGKWLSFVVNTSRPQSIVAWIVGRDGRNLRRIATVGIDTAAEWAPSGLALAVTSPNFRQGSVRSLRGAAQLRFSGRFLGWSRGGMLAVGTPGTPGAVRILDGAGRELTRAPGIGAAWSPDGSLLAVEGRDGIRVVRTRGGLRLRARNVSAPRWAPDGTLFARDKEFRLVRVGLDGTRSLQGAAGLELAWNADGQLATIQERIVVVRQPGGVRRVAFPGRAGPCPTYVGQLAWLDRDRLLVTVGSGGQQETDLWVAAATGGALSRFPGSDQMWVDSPEWSPNGARVLYEHGPVHTHGGGCIWESPRLRLVAADGSGARFLTPGSDDGYEQRPRWSRDGRLIAFEQRTLDVDPDAGIAVLDPAGTQTRRTLGGQGSAWPSWSSDGTKVVYELGGEIQVATLTGGTASTIGRGEEPEAAPTAPLVAFLRSNGLWTSALDGSGARRLAAVSPRNTEFEPNSQEPPRWSPDSQHLALADGRGILIVSRSGNESRRIDAPGARGVAWSPDGRALSYARPVGTHSRLSFNSSLWARTELYVVEVAGGQPRRLTDDLANVGRASWRP